MRAPHTVVKAKNVQISQRETLSNSLIQSSSTPCPPPKCGTYPLTCLHFCYQHSSPSLQHSSAWCPCSHSYPCLFSTEHLGWSFQNINHTPLTCLTPSMRFPWLFKVRCLTCRHVDFFHFSYFIFHWLYSPKSFLAPLASEILREAQLIVSCCFINELFHFHKLFVL